ncbi:hypothetical protein FH972_019447 [Carpinus fangiana]|uniref:Uncharacterized protein n=1 Tax=Carpinus fangiana TaxID=176857 RepID=A0A5N6RSD1_9ROSI|nr:hypothetical protein FH972_019447 [Carpinus fangiana]
MADRARAFCKEEVVTYAYLLLYIALSSGQIFFNKVRPSSCTTLSTLGGYYVSRISHFENPLFWSNFTLIKTLS